VSAGDRWTPDSGESFLALKVFENETIEWVKREGIDASIAAMGKLLFHNRETVSLAAITEPEIKEWLGNAKDLLGEMISVGNFTDDDLDMQLIEADRAGVVKYGLTPYLLRRRSAHEFKGLGEKELAEKAKDFDKVTLLLDLKKEGQRAFVTEEFLPNGGRNFTQSKSYRENSALCNRHIFKLLTAGKAVIVPWDDLSEMEKMKVHVNTLQLAPSSNPNREGRCCINMSYKTPAGNRRSRGSQHQGKAIEKLISINEGTDLVASDLHYPPVVLPTASDLCEMAEKQRTFFEPIGEALSGATIDISDAYRQFTVSVEAIMHRTVMLTIAGVKYIVFALAGWFGDTRAGHVYNLTGSFIDHRHNTGCERKRSLTYVDDGILIDGESRIDESRGKYRASAEEVHGPGCIEPRKDLKHGQDLEAIGWYMNLRYDQWRIGPKPKALTKIFAALFLRLPPDVCDEVKTIQLSRRTLLEIAGLLTWYSEVLRVGKPFVHSLFQCAGYTDLDALRTLSVSAKRDIAWWKIIAMASMKDPFFMSASISHLRRNVEVDCWVISDASTSVGCGGWLSESAVYNEADTPAAQAFIRWTEVELNAFEEGINGKPVDINILEYFGVMYMVMLLGDRLRGKRVGIKSDNTAAVAWLLKSRASTKSPIGEALVQVFALYCICMDITLVPSHLAGKYNVRADLLSRDLFLQETTRDPPHPGNDPAEMIALGDTHWWHGLKREVICRQLLLASIGMPWTLPWQSLLDLLKALQ
jgi:hypothetical protein